ncbi:MAG: hypothetical protein U0228_31865 [Myxococcaceae bacterium]
MRALLLLPLLGLFAGCESVADVVTKQKPAVEKTFTALTALGPKVTATPEFTKLEVKAPAVPLKLDGDGANAVYVYADDLAKPGRAAEVAVRSIDTLPLLHCGSLLEKQQYFNDGFTRLSPSIVNGYLEACAKARYALVIRNQQFLRPELSLETKQFAPAKWRADVLVFDLTTGDALGGFPVVATNDSRVSLLDGDQDHVKRILENLESCVFDAIRDGTRAAFPGSLKAKEAK